MAQNKLKLVIASWLALASLLPVNAEERLPVAVRQQLLAGDYQPALIQLSELASAGHSQAQYQLALFYLNGLAVTQSAEEAERLLLLAAANNNKASYLLGSLYASGKQLNRDLLKARLYLELSRKEGNPMAKQLIAKLFAKTGSASEIQQQPQHLFEQLIKRGELAKAIRLQQRGAMLNAKNSDGDTPLLIAVKNQRDDVALWLMQQTLNLDAQDVSGNSALHLAAAKNQGKVSNSLISNKADINLTNRKKQTPLIAAIIAGNRAIAQNLINKGAKTALSDTRGKTAVDYAMLGDIDLIFKSEQPGNSKKALSAEQRTIRLEALNHQAADQKSPYYGWPTLAIAIAQKQSELIDHLIAAGHNPWQTNPQNDNAIAIAMSSGETELSLDLLGQSGAGSPQLGQLIDLFEVAIKQNRLKVVARLLNFTDAAQLATLPIERTPLWFAIQHNRTDIAKLVIRKLPPDNRLDSQRRSYLVLAAEHECPQISQLLGATELEVNHQDDQGRSALWYAANLANDALTDILLNQQSNVELADNQGYTPLMRAVIKGCYACVNALIIKGADAEQQSSNGNSALMLAAQGKDKILQLLLNNRVDIRSRNRQSLTPLLLAVKTNSPGCVKLLLAAGANPNRKNANGENAFELAKSNQIILDLLEKV